jgi:hypothetical protein
MSCLSAFLNSRAVLYDVDRTGTTDSGQPTEVLTLNRNMKVYFEEPSMADSIYKLFSAGQIKTLGYVCLSLSTVSLGQVISIEVSNDEKFIINNVFPLRFGMITLGYQLHLDRWKH